MILAVSKLVQWLVRTKSHGPYLYLLVYGNPDVPRTVSRREITAWSART